MNNEDAKKKEPFGPEDDSDIAKILRGELEVAYDKDAKPSPRVSAWETASIRSSDGAIVVCINGTNLREYSSDNPRYFEIIEKLREKFPDLAPGVVCKLTRYSDGTTKIKTTQH